MAIEPDLIVGLASALSTVLGGVVSWAAKSIRRTAKPPAPLPPADLLTKRLDEAQRELERQQELARAHRVAGWLLTFGQFVIGGLLASSFVQQTLSATLVGGLGLLVLISSLLRQHYQPEVELSAARRRVAKLKDVLREVEDQLELRKEGSAKAMTSEQLRALLRSAMTDVEALGTAVTPSAPAQDLASPPGTKKRD